MWNYQGEGEPSMSMSMSMDKEFVPRSYQGRTNKPSTNKQEQGQVNTSLHLKWQHRSEVR
jgi:hypothetical protein